MSKGKPLSAIELWRYAEQLHARVAHIEMLLDCLPPTRKSPEHDQLQKVVLELNEFLSVNLNIPDDLYDPEVLAFIKEGIPF